MRDACYVYCITQGKMGDVNLTGIDGEKVCTITVDGITVLVHNCTQEPYQGEDDEVKEWILQHNQVVEKVWLQQGTVIPMTFDVIVKGKGEMSASENIYSWVIENKRIIKGELEELMGKSEYSVKIIINNKFNLLDSKAFSIEKNGELKGLSYLQQKKLRRNARGIFIKKLAKLQEQYKEKISELVSQVVENRNKKLNDGEQEILNLSLLATEKEAKKLGILLDEINNIDNVRVRYTGPWPPYSFLGNMLTMNE